MRPEKVYGLRLSGKLRKNKAPAGELVLQGEALQGGFVSASFCALLLFHSHKLFGHLLL